MGRQIILILLELIIVSPILFFTLKNKKRDTFYILSIFVIFVFLHHLSLFSYTLKPLHFFKQNWNWSGKFLAICGSIIFLISYKKFPITEYGITFHQKEKSIHFSLIVLSVYVLVAILVGFFVSQKTNFNIETLAFEFTMPAIDEELALRGIMIGLLSQILIDNIKIKNLKFINPSILITAILFGLLHALNLNKNFSISFDSVYFLWTFIFGFVVGWVFVKSKSILYPIIIHSVLDTMLFLIPMLL